MRPEPETERRFSCLFFPIFRACPCVRVPAQSLDPIAHDTAAFPGAAQEDYPNSGAVGALTPDDSLALANRTW